MVWGVDEWECWCGRGCGCGVKVEVVFKVAWLRLYE